MSIVQALKLNMIPESAPVILNVDQYDTGTGRIVAQLYNGATPYTPGAGAPAKIQGTKPDMHGFQYDATLSGSTVTADLEQQMSCVAGNVRTQIVITETSGRTGTFAFIMRVQASALDDDTIISDTELPDIIDAAESNAERAEQAAADAETWATRSPYIGANGNWFVWDPEQEEFVDTGIPAEGADDYNDLRNKPQINSVTLTGNKTTEDLSLNIHATVSGENVTIVQG